MSPFILVDDSTLYNSGFWRAGISGKQWQLIRNSDSAFNGTVSVCNTRGNTTTTSTASSSSTTQPSLSLTFSGSSIALIGTGAENLALNYTLDDQSIHRGIMNSSFIGQTGIKLWGLSGLEPKEHTLTLFPVTGQLTVDYLLYTAAGSAKWTGSNVVMDDQEGSIAYAGTWTPVPGASFPKGSPLNDTVTRSSTQGSSFLVQFTGSTIGVYGAFNGAPGKLATTYILDGGAPVQIAHFNGSQTPNTNAWSLNQELFFQDLAPGKHTLNVTLSEVSGNQAFYFDYVAFEAVDDTPLGSSSSKPTGSIVGGVIGLLVLLFIAGFCYRSFSRRNDTYVVEPVPSQNMQSQIVINNQINMPQINQTAPPGWRY